MTTTENRNRQPKGVSTGGQYAAETKGEAPVGLGVPAPAAPAPAPRRKPSEADRNLMLAASYYQDAVDLQEFADRLRELDPEAVAVNAETSNYVFIEYRTADGTVRNRETTDEELYFPERNDMVFDMGVESSWIELSAVDTETERHAGLYYAALTRGSHEATETRTKDAYVADLAEQIALRHRVAIAHLDGDTDYAHADAQSYLLEEFEGYGDPRMAAAVRETLEDLGGNPYQVEADRFAPVLRRNLGQAEGAHPSWSRLQDPATEQAFLDAVTDAVRVTPTNPSGKDRSVEIANGAYANSYINADGIPTVAVHTDGGYEGQVKLVLNDNDLYIGDPDKD